MAMAMATEARVERLAAFTQDIRSGLQSGNINQVNYGMAGIDVEVGPHIQRVIFINNGHNQESATEGRYEVLFKFYQSVDSIDLNRYPNLMPWFNATARNWGIDERRKQNARPRVADPLPGHDEVAEAIFADHMVDALGIEMKSIVRQAVNHLPAPQREALVMAYWGGYTQSEIAARTGNPLGTEKARIRLGLQRVKGWFIQNYGEDFRQDQYPGASDKNTPKPKPVAQVSHTLALKQKAVNEINYFLGISPDEIAEIVREPRSRVAGWIEAGIRRKPGERLPPSLIERRRLLQRPVTEIPVDRAVPIILRFMSEFSTSQTAQVLELTLGEARASIRNGLSSLNEIKDRILSKEVSP